MENLDVDGDAVKLHEDVVWVNLTLDRDLWQAVVNTVMNLRVQ